MEEILKSKGKILQYLNDHNYDFSSCFKFEDDNFVIGYIGGTGNNSKKYSILTMFNAFNNTKNNAIKAIKEYLDFNDDNIISDNVINVNELFNPYYKSKQYYPLENLAFRVGSLWDELAHICNLFYDLNIKIKDVDDNKLKKLKKNYRNNNSILAAIYDYLNDKNSFANVNCHHFCKEVRNRLIHYCDFNAMKFLSEYTENLERITPYPTGYYFAFFVFDIFKVIEFARQIHEEFLNLLTDSK